MNKKTLYKIHKWSGLSLGVLIFLLALSGLSITFREELLPKSYPELFHVTPQEKVLPADKLYEAGLLKKSSTQRITNLYTAHDEDEAYMLMVKDDTKTFPLIWTIDPYTANITGEISMIKNFYAVMLMLHTNFFAGKIGSYIVGLMGIVLTFFVVSGFIIFTPAKHKLQRYKSLLNFSWNSQKIHHQLGIALSIPLLISALTGMFIVFDIPYYGARLFGTPVRIEEATLTGFECDVEQERAVLQSISQDKEDRLISIHFCSPKNSLMKVTYGQTEKDFLDGYVREVINPGTGETLQVFDSKIDPSSWNFKRLIVYPIHTGQYFGLIGRIINFFLGVMLVVIFLSGIRLSIKRALRA